LTWDDYVEEFFNALTKERFDDLFEPDDRKTNIAIALSMLAYMRHAADCRMDPKVAAEVFYAGIKEGKADAKVTEKAWLN
jgi:hypothetical protein